jgi:hypothetical protein
VQEHAKLKKAIQGEHQEDATGQSQNTVRLQGITSLFESADRNQDNKLSKEEYSALGTSPS